MAVLGGVYVFCVWWEGTCSFEDVLPRWTLVGGVHSRGKFASHLYFREKTYCSGVLPINERGSE